MDIEQALTTYLLAQTGITALVDRRIHPDLMLARGKFPAIVWNDVSDRKNHTLTGQLALTNPMIQYTIYADTKAECKTIEIQLKTALSDYNGTLSGIVVDYIRLNYINKGIYKNEDGTVEKHMTDLEFEVNYQEGA